MPIYGPWTWSQPHNRHYSNLIADDGATVLDTIWAGPTGPTTTVASANLNTATPSSGHSASTPRADVNTSLASLQPYTQPISPHPQWTSAANQPAANQYVSQSHANASSSRQIHRTTRPAYRTGREEAGPYQQHQNYRESEMDRAGNVAESGMNYKTQPYRTPSTQSYPSAQPSMTSASGSPYPLQNPQAQSSYPFVPSSPTQAQRTTQSTATGQPSEYPGPRRPVASLPVDVQSTIQSLDRRYIQTNPNDNFSTEQLDIRYRRVAPTSRGTFFVLGRVFKMLWTEPAGQVNPGKTRNSTHFSTVRFGQTAFSEIRRFVVVRNKGEFSQCIPIQTYRGQGAAKPGLRMSDHGVIHTTVAAPNLLFGEELTKYSIQVQSTDTEYLEPESRVNYGKAYAVEHNVKVLDVGMVMKGHRYLIRQYFDAAMLGD